MRIVTLNYVSAEKFLAHYSDAYPFGALHCRTRVDFAASEEAIAEVWFPGLPGRMCMRGSVLGYDRGYDDSGQGAFLLIHEADQLTRDFVVGIARGERWGGMTRAYCRLPIDVPVVCRFNPRAATTRSIVSVTEDVGAGGLCVRSDVLPARKERVRVVLGPIAGDSLVLYGSVAWSSERNGDPAFGIQLDRRGLDGDMRRLRSVLRRVYQSGRIPVVH